MCEYDDGWLEDGYEEAIKRVEILEAENRALRKLVKAAYSEGYNDGVNILGEPEVDWRDSETKSKLDDIKE